MHQHMIDQIRQSVKSTLMGEGSGHDWWHVDRVCHLARHLHALEGQGDPLVIELASLLHDVKDHKFGFSDQDRTDLVEAYLQPFNMEQDLVDHVVYIINHMSFKRGENKHILQTIEGKIVQDADRLDAMGAIGVARTFAYGGHQNRPLYVPKEDKSDLSGQDSITHFHEKLFKLKDLMNTDAGSLMAKKRHQVMVDFMATFLSEWHGHT